MYKRQLKIYLTPTENSIVIQSLNNLRNAMLKENRDTGCIDELLLKVMCLKSFIIAFKETCENETLIQDLFLRAELD